MTVNLGFLLRLAPRAPRPAAGAGRKLNQIKGVAHCLTYGRLRDRLVCLPAIANLFSDLAVRPTQDLELRCPDEVLLLFFPAGSNEAAPKGEPVLRVELVLGCPQRGFGQMFLPLVTAIHQWVQCGNLRLE